jgi:hypothetical protein
MTSMFRITSGLLRRVHEDLSRSHPFAAERVAFLTCKTARLDRQGVVVLAQAVHSVADEDYERSSTMGALLGSAAFRKILQYGYGRNLSIFHVHRHEHFGRPGFSRVDVEESAKYVPDFFKVCPQQVHGTVVLSHNSAAGLIWHGMKAKPGRIDRFAFVGYPLVEVNGNQRH